MKLTQQADYSLRVLLYLAIEPERVSTIGEIAGAYDVSAHHLAKVAQLLGRLGYVQLIRGQAGGLKLAKPASAIRLGAVLRKTEPSMALVECFDPENNRCPITPACALKGILANAQEAFLAVIDGYTLADATKQRAQLSNLLELRLSATASR